VLDSTGDTLQGRVLVNLDSGTPTEAHEAAGRATERGAEYLDGAIMVPPPLVGHPESV
jgi:3-hydroxyisobutyrate dehydrogenase-like beta-hydroxyacid dehydrogenase